MTRRPALAQQPATLICPGCGAQRPPEALFCETCLLPLVPPGTPREADTRDERHLLARKIKPQLAEGRLVHVVQARSQVDAEFIQGLLLEEGVPSLARRSAGFDVPDFLAAGPRDILVPESGFDVARETLLQADIPMAAPAAPEPPLKLLAGLLLALAIGALIVWLLTLVVR
jgi:hypothetical protein